MAFRYLHIYFDGNWESVGPSNTPSCSLGVGSHITWLDDGALRMTRLADGARYDPDQDTIEIAEKQLTQSRLNVATVREVQLGFALSADGWSIELDPLLGKCAEDAGAAFVELIVDGQALRASRVNDLWCTTAAREVWQSKTITIPGGPMLDAVFRAVWQWRPGSCEFCLAESGKRVSRDVANQEWSSEVHLRLTSLLPEDAVISIGKQRWFPSDAARQGDAYQYRLTTDGRSLSCGDLAGDDQFQNDPILEIRFREQCILLRPAGFVSEPDLQETRYAASLEGNQVKPPRDWQTRSGHDSITAAYGPRFALCPNHEGVGKCRVIRRSEDSDRLSLHPGLRAGKLPVDVDAADFQDLCVLWAYHRPDSYGVVAAASDIEAGSWKPVTALPDTFSGQIAWQGLIDTASVRTVKSDGHDLLCLEFAVGFRLGPRFWPAAPFLGIAMEEDASFWAPAEEPSNVRLQRTALREWNITGPWHLIGDPTARLFANGACVVPAHKPQRVCIFGSAQPGDRSTPILEVDSAEVPILRGFLADKSGRISTLRGHLTLGSSDPVVWQRDGQAPRGWTESHDAALQAALNSQESQGRHKRLGWKKQIDRTIEFRTAGPYDVYVFDPNAGPPGTMKGDD